MDTATWIFNQAVMYRHIFTFGGQKFEKEKWFAEMEKHGVHGTDALETLLKAVDEAIEENEPRRKFVVSYMHYSGEKYGLLTSKQMWWVYLKADGFGKRSAYDLRRLNDGWDWSHIRDSTIDGWKAMERELRKHI
jgi:hypothetical protein